MNPPRVDVEVLAASLPWLATSAFALGVLSGAVACALRTPSVRRWRALLSVYAIPVSLLAASSLLFHGFRAPFAGAAALAGLMLLGATVAASPQRAIALVPWALVACALLDGAASGWGALEAAPPFSPETTALLIDSSPRAFVMESAGADWMRHESIYEHAGTDRLGPDLRIGYGGSVAAYVVLVLGYCSATLRFAIPSRASERSPDATHTA